MFSSLCTSCFVCCQVSVSTLPSTSHRRRILHLRYGFQLRLLLFSSSLLLCNPFFAYFFSVFFYSSATVSRKWRHLGSRLTIELSVISLFSVSYPRYTHMHTNAHTHAGFTHRHTSVTDFASLRYPLSFTVQHLIAKNQRDTGRDRNGGAVNSSPGCLVISPTFRSRTGWEIYLRFEDMCLLIHYVQFRPGGWYPFTIPRIHESDPTLHL